MYNLWHLILSCQPNPLVHAVGSLKAPRTGLRKVPVPHRPRIRLPPGVHSIGKRSKLARLWGGTK